MTYNPGDLIEVKPTRYLYQHDLSGTPTAQALENPHMYAYTEHDVVIVYNKPVIAANGKPMLMLYDHEEGECLPLEHLHIVGRADTTQINKL